MRTIAILALCFFSFSAHCSSVSELYRTKALLAMDEANYEQALEALSLAVEADQNDGLAYFYRGVLRSRLGHINESLKDLLQAQKKGVDNGPLSHELGIVYFNKQSYREAIPYFKQSLALHPQHANSAYHLGLSHYFLGDDGLALPLLEHAAGWVTKNDVPNLAVSISLSRARILQSMGRMGEAKAILSSIIEQEKGSDFAEVAQSLLAGEDSEKKQESANLYHITVEVGGAYDSNAGLFPTGQPLPKNIDQAENTRAQLYLNGDIQLWQLGKKTLVGEYQYFQNEHKDTYSDDFNMRGHVLGLDFRMQHKVGDIGVSYQYSTLDLSGVNYINSHALTPYLAVFHGDLRYSMLKLMLTKSDYLLFGENGRDNESIAGHYRHYWLSKSSQNEHFFSGGRYTQENARDNINSYRLMGIEAGVQRMFKRYLLTGALGFERLDYYKAPVTRGNTSIGLGFNRDDRRFDVQVGLAYTINKHWALSSSLVYNYNHSNDPLFEYRRWVATGQVKWSL